MFSSLVCEDRARFKNEKKQIKDMTHEEFLKELKRIKLFKYRTNKNKAINKLLKERFAPLIDAFCKIDNSFYIIKGIVGGVNHTRGGFWCSAPCDKVTLDLCPETNEVKGLRFETADALDVKELYKVEQNTLRQEEVIQNLLKDIVK